MRAKRYREKCRQNHKEKKAFARRYGYDPYAIRPKGTAIRKFAGIQKLLIAESLINQQSKGGIENEEKTN